MRTASSTTRTDTPTAFGAGLVDRFSAFAAQIMRARENRRAVRALMELDDYLLKDIGISRGGIESTLEAASHRRSHTRG